jgi:hypothetical protein
MRMLYDDHGPQGDRTAAEWEEKLQSLDVNKGINVTIATYHECITNLTRVRRLDEHGIPVDSPDRSINSYCPSNERLKRFLLSALDKAPHTSPYHRMAQELRLTANAGRDPEYIIDLMREYKDIGHDTIPVRRQAPQPYDRRRPYAHPGNRGERYQGGYSGNHASYEEEDPPFDPEEDYYQDELLQEFIAASASHVSNPTRYICSNCKGTGHLAKDCRSLKCYTCNKTFDTPEQRKNHWYADHRNDSRASTSSNTPDRRPHDNKRRVEEQTSPHMKQVQPRRSERVKTPHNSSRSSNPVEPEYDYYGPRDEEEDQPEI